MHGFTEEEWYEYTMPPKRNWKLYLYIILTAAAAGFAAYKAWTIQ